MGACEPPRTLVVEDDPGMRDFYARFFARHPEERFSVVIVPDTPSALAVLRREAVDLVLVDWSLPGISGEVLVRAMRDHPKTRAVCVLMITGRLTADDEVRALAAGADDYMTKPVDEDALLSRLRDLKRRRLIALGRRLARPYPGLAFEPAANQVLVEGRLIRLTPKESGLLWLLLQPPGVQRTLEELWESLWGYPSANRQTVLDATAAALKLKLGEAWGGRLKRIDGEGYSFESPC